MFVGEVVVVVDVLSEDFDDIPLVGRIGWRGGSHSHDGGENKLKCSYMGCATWSASRHVSNN